MLSDDTQRYGVNTSRPPDTVAAFDTDMTVDYAGGPVPLSHITDLRETDDVLVWSTGYNQSLRNYAQVPGMAELKARLDDAPEWIGRADRMRHLRDVFPGAGRYLVVDDIDVRELESEGWEVFHPAEYAVEELGIAPAEWPERVGMTPREYLTNIGRFSGQYEPPGLRDRLGVPTAPTAREDSG
jgi:hypothetical protein